jgi:hypothetical protein
MAKMTLYPCISKTSDGTITVDAYLDPLTGTTYTAAEVAAMNRCPLFDTERTTVCYTTDGGTTILTGGTLVEVFEIDPDTGLPNTAATSTTLYDVAGADITSTGAVAACLSLPDSEVREVCVDTDSNGSADQKGLQHISYSVDNTGTVVANAILTELDGTTPLTGDVVECPTTFLGTPVEVCAPPAP